jgi:hypothetical protein
MARKVIQTAIDDLIRTIPEVGDMEDLRLIEEKITYLESLQKEE